MNARFIFVTGGVVSSLGKGICASSLAALLQARGYKVRLRKMDPYLNVDPGTMNPMQHGEVYVTDDGIETDLDLGHYERFSAVSTTKFDSITTGKIYASIIARERKGDFLGGTIQIIPHVTNAIKDFIVNDITDEDFVICEVGGTVGDIEGQSYLEAIRQLRSSLPIKPMFIHLTLLPYIAVAGELKTKPTQHSVQALLSAGIQPDMIACRSEKDIEVSVKDKIALFCNVKPENVIRIPDVDTIYRVPKQVHEEGMDESVLKYFGVNPKDHPIDFSKWDEFLYNYDHPEGDVRVAVVGKYACFPEAYKSIAEAFKHAGAKNRTRVHLDWIESARLESEEAKAVLAGYNGILVPGGFGDRGTEGKIAAIKYARENKIPFFGICLGLQMAVAEAARNLLGYEDANSTEFNPNTKHPVIHLIREWKNEQNGKIEKRDEDSDKGASMRLGAYPCVVKEGSLVSEIYGEKNISERHRHRYEVNMDYVDALNKAGFEAVGMSPDGRLPEILENKNHPWFIGVQFHPELKSRPFAPAPLFASFVKAALDHSRLI